MTGMHCSEIVVGVAPHHKHEAALEYAAHEARRRGVGVRVAVVEHPFLAEGRDTTELELVEGELRRAGTDLLVECERTLRTWLPHELPIRTELVHGRPATSLVATSAQADLVVLQHHHMGRAFHVPTLSTTNAVASRSRVPVVAVPDDWHEAMAPSGVVLACVEDADSGQRVVQHAFTAARRLGVAVRVLHSWSWVEAEPDEDQDLRTGSAAERSGIFQDRLREGLLPLIEANADVVCRVETRQGQPGWVLTQASNDARLVVIGRHSPSHRWGSHLGPVTRTALTYARVPVEVVDTSAAVVTSSGPSSGPSSRR